jgi:hypothetical protein
MQDDELGGGARWLYYILERGDGTPAEMSVILRDGEVDQVLLTTPDGDYFFRGASAESFIEFIEKELLGTRLLRSVEEAAPAEPAQACY